LRRAYHLQFSNDEDCVDFTEGPSTKGPSSFSYVAKISIDPYEDREVYFDDVKMQLYAKEWANKFNKFKPPKNVDFVKAGVLELISREGKPLCGVERFIDGPYHKHNNNYGFVSDIDRNTPQAFSHFTYEASGHRLLICDIQGVGDRYTDPQFHTIGSIQTFGKGNLGEKGFEKFLQTHRCNAICKYLRLPAVNEKQDDGGTLPAQMVSTHVTVNTQIHHYPKYPPSNLSEISNPINYDVSDTSPLLGNSKNGRKKGSNDEGGCCIIS